MASMVRILAQQARNVRRSAVQIRCISTSKRDKNVTAIADELTGKESKEVSAHTESNNKNWISYGYSFEDQTRDKYEHWMNMFMGVTLCIVGGAFILTYMPDFRMKEWSVREAYLQMAKRDEEGKPHIDANLVPLEEIVLPTDEELGEQEIII